MWRLKHFKTPVTWLQALMIGAAQLPSRAPMPGIDDSIKTLWERVIGYQRRIEEILFEDRTKISNEQRALIITETNNMVQACAEFQAMATWRDGVVGELRRQLDDARREAADLRVAVALGATPGPSRSYASVLAGRSDGVPPALHPQDPLQFPLHNNRSERPSTGPLWLAPPPPSASHVAFLNLVVEDIHVSLCTFCASYGHTSRYCPVKDDPTRALCTKCAEQHLSRDCAITMAGPAVSCAPCRRRVTAAG
ncbi:hypothetical protein HPB50_009346 [Hyalomma asiaticum]|uniref:Uncharacterized protein n=1 Tax=Hyalomma asiaticum TaxID=266040 RepID=A0ACB7T3Q1_HYAAI|nr:hypothetical protein HPB50_009346 [Hyalomma asiaticum]